MNTTATTNVSEQAAKLVTWLSKIKAGDDKATMAELRCLLNENLRPRGWMALAPVQGIGHEVKETISGLFATHPLHTDKPDFSIGRSIRILKASDNSSTIDTHFRRLISADRKELKEQLTNFIRRLKDKEIPVNYAKLYEDMTFWSDRVKERWAQDYWSSQEEEADHVSE